MAVSNEILDEMTESFDPAIKKLFEVMNQEISDLKLENIAIKNRLYSVESRVYECEKYNSKSCLILNNQLFLQHKQQTANALISLIPYSTSL